MENKFNLIDEPCIPTNIGWVSIKDCFNNDKIYHVGRTATESICFINFLLAIAQATDDYKYNEDIYDMTISELKDKILNYLDNNYDKFYFYGDKPFLQFNQYLNYERNKDNFFLNINTIDETVCSGNNAIVHDSQFKKHYSDAEKFCQLIVNLGSPCVQKIYFKKTPIIFTSTPNYIKSPKKDGKKKGKKGEQSVNTYKGVFNGFQGILHSFLTGKRMLQTMYVNLKSQEDLEYINENISAMGKPPWEIDDLVEDHEYKNTYYSYLIPMNRFMLFFEDDNENCFYEDGICYDDEWIQKQPSIYTYNYEKINERNETKTIVTSIVKPSLHESVICSLVDFWIHKKAQNYNFMKSKKIIEEANLDENDFCVEYYGTSMELNSGANYLNNYIQEIIPFNSNFYQSYNYENFSNFMSISEGIKRWIDYRKEEINSFYHKFYSFEIEDNQKKDNQKTISFVDDFDKECKKLIKQAEIRAINGDFDIEKELKIFKEKAKSILIDIYDLKNPFRRGEKLAILTESEFEYLHF